MRARARIRATTMTFNVRARVRISARARIRASAWGWHLATLVVLGVARDTADLLKVLLVRLCDRFREATVGSREPERRAKQLTDCGVVLLADALGLKLWRERLLLDFELLPNPRALRNVLYCTLCSRQNGGGSKGGAGTLCGS